MPFNVIQYGVSVGDFNNRSHISKTENLIVQQLIQAWSIHLMVWNYVNSYVRLNC